MALEYIIPLIIFLIAAIIIFRVTKTIAKAIFLVTAIFCAMIVIFSLIIIYDVYDFNNRFSTDQSLYLLESPEGTLAAGVYAVIGDTLAESISNVQKDDLMAFQSSFNAKNLGEIRGDNYKLFIIKDNVLTYGGDIKVGDETLKREEVVSLLKSNAPIDDYVAKRAPDGRESAYKQKLMEQLKITSEAEFKDMLFAVSFFPLANPEGTPALINSLRKGEIKVYPSTVLFDLFKSGPQLLVDKILGVGE